MRYRLAALIIVAGIGLAEAAPNIPPSELPGRERDRFMESPLDRFMQPGQPKGTQPLWQWNCDTGKTKRGKRKGQKPKGC